MKDITLMKKLTFLAVLFGLVVSVTFVVVLFSVSKVSSGNDTLSQRMIPVINKGHELKLSVVQVQQWLTDISATRAQDGLNDGFDEAAANAAHFRELVAELGELDPENYEQYQSLLPTFNAYYEVGKKMAQSYIDHGPAGGNKVMAEFDGVAASISEQVDTMLENISERSKNLIGYQGGNLRDMKYVVFGALIFLTALVSLTLLVIYRAVRLLPQVVEELQRIADGDLTSERKVSEANDELGMLCRGLGVMKKRLKALLTQVHSTSDHLAAAAEEMTAITDQTRESIDRQQMDINQVATAMNEMSASANEVAENANLTSSSAKEANDAAHSGRTVVQASIGSIRSLAENVNNASEVIRKLEQDSEQIGSILDVIRGIADQTNLLALNAAIEAARAGEQGRGFAVVADEVRTLASRTQESTQEIQQMIERLQEGSLNAVHVMEEGRTMAEKSVDQIEQAGDSLVGITTAVESITDMNLQIATAAEEQSKVAEEMAHSVTDISAISDQTSEGAQHTSQASQELAKLSVQLQQLVGHFKL